MQKSLKGPDTVTHVSLACFFSFIRNGSIKVSVSVLSVSLLNYHHQAAALCYKFGPATSKACKSA